MEYTNNRPTETAITAVSDDPRCRAIVAQYGDAHQFYMRLTPAMPSAATPSMVMAMKAYGQQAIFSLLNMRTRFMVVRMDAELLNDEEIHSITTAIAGDPRGRVLGFDLVLSFFDALERGEYELYGFKPRNIIAAWSQFVTSATAKQERIKQQAEHDRREAERRQHDREYLRPDEFRKWKEQFQKNNP